MTGKTGVIYLLKDRFQFYSPFLRQIVEFKFTPEMVMDLDVLNPDLMEEQIKVLITNGKVPPSSLIIVLADNAYFVKDFALPQAPPAQAQKPGQPPAPVPKVSLEDLKPQIDLFVEHVPYENVVSKSFPLKTGMRVCAVNQDLYTTVQRAFEKINFTVDAVLPGMVLGGGLSAKPVMDGMLANTAIQKAPTLKQYDLKSQEAFSPIQKKEEQADEVQQALENSKEPPKTDKKRLAVMIGVLGLLLVVLVIVTVQSMQPPPPNNQPTLASQPTTMPPMATATAIQPTAGASTEQVKNLSLQIVSSAGTASTAQTLRSAFDAYAFKTITNKTENNVGSATTIVSFSVNTPQTVRNIVLDEVRKVKTEVRVQEAQTGSNDITIIIGK
jgi:hypothetical protein